MLIELHLSSADLNMALSSFNSSTPSQGLIFMLFASKPPTLCLSHESIIRRAGEQPKCLSVTAVEGKSKPYTRTKFG